VTTSLSPEQDGPKRAAAARVAGTNGPKGEHLVALAHHSDAVHEAFSRLAGREQAVAVGKVVTARDMLLQVIALLQSAVG
jgi:hypothetical protein